MKSKAGCNVHFGNKTNRPKGPFRKGSLHLYSTRNYLWMAALQILEMEANTPVPYTLCLVSLQLAGHLAMNSGRLILPARTSHSIEGTTTDERTDRWI